MLGADAEHNDLKSLMGNSYGCFLRLLLQLEGVLNALELGKEEFVGHHALFHLSATVDHRRMVAVADEFADSCSRHFGVFLCQIHAHLPRHHIIALAAFAVDVGFDPDTANRGMADRVASLETDTKELGEALTMILEGVTE